ncbi:hypothetical protein C0099_15660 [Pseudazoarcus pumilus]|uniref:TIGR02611 family protein n=2 Tax=Pseudazoarcus pumilus TaxID=2067960 RepID=A0A2I6SAH1_9RHOO|nr:hypothetical protein C0099_15660 [Pseudazoarcus pumilus]
MMPRAEESNMLHNIKREFRAIRDGVPGRRFVDHYERSRHRHGMRGSLWASCGYVAAGLVLVIVGLVASLPPGVPGFLLWIPGLALLASRSRGLALLLDRLEAWTRRMWARYRRRP